MNILKQLTLLTITLGIIIINSHTALALLGNTPEQNAEIYGKSCEVPKYSFGGEKKVIKYKTENAAITVVYKNNVSIMENITYKDAIKKESALNNIKKYVMPSDEKPSFSSTGPFANSYYEENIYKNNVKVKLIFNGNDNITEIISSLAKEEAATKEANE